LAEELEAYLAFEAKILRQLERPHCFTPQMRGNNFEALIIASKLLPQLSRYSTILF
jgi:hypothetical protein